MAKNQGKGSNRTAPAQRQNPHSAASVNQKTPLVSSPPVSAHTSRYDSTKKPAGKITPPPVYFIFGKRNYQIMIAGILLIALGFFLMAGTSDIMSTTKIVIAPIVVLLGFAVEFYAILAKPVKSA